MVKSISGYQPHQKSLKANSDYKFFQIYFLKKTCPLQASCHSNFHVNTTGNSQGRCEGLSLLILIILYLPSHNNHILPCSFVSSNKWEVNCFLLYNFHSCILWWPSQIIKFIHGYTCIDLFRVTCLFDHCLREDKVIVQPTGVTRSVSKESPQPWLHTQCGVSHESLESLGWSYGCAYPIQTSRFSQYLYIKRRGSSSLTPVSFSFWREWSSYLFENFLF